MKILINKLMNFDDFQIWNKALTESEILTYMTEELSGNEDNLLAYYKIEVRDLEVRCMIFQEMVSMHSLLQHYFMG